MTEPIFNLDLKTVVQWVAANAWRESVWLNPYPAWNVSATELLDFLSEESGVSKKTIGDWVDEISDQKERDRLDASA